MSDLMKSVLKKIIVNQLKENGGANLLAVFTPEEAAMWVDLAQEAYAEEFVDQFQCPVCGDMTPIKHKCGDMCVDCHREREEVVSLDSL